MAVASPKRLSTANLARDPRTGKGVQYYLHTVLSTIDYCFLKNTLCLNVMYNIAEKTEFTPRFLVMRCKNRLLHRECAVWVFIHESQNE